MTLFQKKRGVQFFGEIFWGGVEIFFTRDFGGGSKIARKKFFDPRPKTFFFGPPSKKNFWKKFLKKKILEKKILEKKILEKKFLEKKFLEKKFHVTASNLYRSYYPHRSRELVSPVCGIFSWYPSLKYKKKKNLPITGMI